jgi:hypothetical protein
VVLRLTLDLDCVLPLIDPDCSTAYRDELDVLAELEDEGVVDLNYAGTTIRELKRGNHGGSPVRIPVFSGMAPGMTRLDVTELDDPSTVLAPKGAPALDSLLRGILRPGLDVNDPRFEKKISDVDQLLAHVIAKRDVFVTGNTKDFKPGRVKRLAELRIVVMTPREVLSELGREPPTS